MFSLLPKILLLTLESCMKFSVAMLAKGMKNFEDNFFKMKCLALDRDIIDKHFQKMAKILVELGRDINLKQTFVSSLPKILTGRIMTILEDKY